MAQKGAHQKMLCQLMNNSKKETKLSPRIKMIVKNVIIFLSN